MRRVWQEAKWEGATSLAAPNLRAKCDSAGQRALFCSHHGGIPLPLHRVLPLILLRSTSLWVFQHAEELYGINVVIEVGPEKMLLAN